MVRKTDLESMLGKGGFGSATEMGGFVLYKGPELSLVSEYFCTSIFTSSASVGAADKQSVLNICFPSDSLNPKPPTLLLIML